MRYKYAGYDRSGQLVSGEIEAGSEDEVKMRMRDQSISPRSIVAIRASFSIADAFHVAHKPSLKDLTIFIRQWATMQSAGLTLMQSLAVLSEQSPDRAFAKTLNNVVKEIQEGQTLTQALQRQNGVFDKVFINLIGAGEGSGTLDKILERLATYYEKIAATRRKLITASVYPASILVIISVIVVALLLFVVPMFEKIFEEQGKDLPGPTVVLIGISRFVRDYVAYILGGAVAGVFSLTYLLKNQDAREKIDPILLYVPLFGTILLKSCLSRFCRTLATLMQAGVPILDSLNLAAKVASNYEIERAAYRIQEAVKEGSPISVPIAKERSFPRMLVSMIAVGEQTGEMEKMLMKIAEFYEDEVDSLVSTMTAVLEPLLIVMMGVVVVCVLIPLYLPIFQLGDIMGN